MNFFRIFLEVYFVIINIYIVFMLFIVVIKYIDRNFLIEELKVIKSAPLHDFKGTRGFFIKCQRSIGYSARSAFFTTRFMSRIALGNPIFQFWIFRFYLMLIMDLVLLSGGIFLDYYL